MEDDQQMEREKAVDSSGNEVFNNECTTLKAEKVVTR